MLVQDRKTGQWYDPQAEFDKLFTQAWVIKQLKRMKFL